jgi:hypothetical protein
MPPRISQSNTFHVICLNENEPVYLDFDGQFPSISPNSRGKGLRSQADSEELMCICIIILLCRVESSGYRRQMKCYTAIVADVHRSISRLGKDREAGLNRVAMATFSNGGFIRLFCWFCDRSDGDDDVESLLQPIAIPLATEKLMSVNVREGLWFADNRYGGG